ncbi:MAG: hypothetical protein JNK95_06175 [Candidatus Competibacter sp.]|nr:hypothetical protein [Candidatus Competibacter sp.]MDG4605019.1 hypothetical protein [Candidatus Contendobacter sp.]HRD50862.1 hypothetical protein [Candidatus Contendobacter sp.]
MSTVSIRISEDPARPLGHAIVTLSGLPRTLETFEFALSRHGFATNYLGQNGWQGAECWLQPEEAWYSEEVLKVVIPPDLAFQLENMPYTLTVRGQGLSGTAAVTFVWPLELAIEDGVATGERRLVGGTRVNAAPKPRPAPAMEPLLPPPLPMPEVGRADLDIPDLPIPELNTGAQLSSDESPTRLAPNRLRGRSIPLDEEPTRKAPGRRVSSDLDEGNKSFTTPAAPPPKPSSPPSKGDDPGSEANAASQDRIGDESPTRIAPPRRPASQTAPQTASPSAAPLDASPEAGNAARRGAPGLLIGLIGLAALAAMAAGGWWWFSRHSGNPPTATAPSPGMPGDNAYRSLEPKPAPEPKPASEPKPAPEPVPAPDPKPAPEPIAPTPPPVPIKPAASTPPPTPRPPAPEPVAPAPPPAPIKPVAPTPPPTPAHPPVAPPTTRIPQTPPSPAVPPARRGSGHSLEDELKSEFDPTVQELEQGLRRQNARELEQGSRRQKSP